MTFVAATQVGPVTVTAGAVTDVGLTRDHNEDSFLCAAPLFLVADGMGGYAAGEVASSTVVEHFTELAGGGALDVREVRHVLARAAQSVRDLEGEREGAGTTLSGVCLVEVDGAPYWTVVNVGDSRTYRLHEGELEQVTVDHSVVQELIDAGELTRDQARVDRRRNVVTRAIGAGAPGEPDFWMVPVEQGERMLVCSDGLSGEVTDDRIREVLLAEVNPERAAQALVNEALANGGRDNVTVVVVDAVAVMERDDDGPDEDTRPRDTEGMAPHASL